MLTKQVAADADPDILGTVRRGHKASLLTDEQSARLRERVVTAATSVGLDPGFVAANLFAEIGTESLDELKHVVGAHSDTTLLNASLGMDDLVTDAKHIRDLVPAFRQVQLIPQKFQYTPEHGGGTKPTANLHSDEALTAFASYVKVKELKARELVEEVGKDFDALPVEQRFFLTRYGISPTINPPALPERLPEFDGSGNVGKGEMTNIAA